MSLADLYPDRVTDPRRDRAEQQVYWPMIDRLREQRESEETLRTLIAADAPHEMVQVLYGLNARTIPGCAASCQ